MRRIARSAGVSQATVSYVLSGKWRDKRISEALAERVSTVAERHGYRRNRLVRALRDGRSHTVALVLPHLVVGYFPWIAVGVESEARLHGYHVLINQFADAKDEAGEIEALLEQRVDGIIMTPRNVPASKRYYRRLVAQRIPLVFVDSYLADIACPAVLGEDEAGMRMATAHLIAQGHRRIGYSGKGQVGYHLRDRLRGFQGAMADAGVPVPRRHVAFGDHASVTAMLKGPDRPTALVAINDYVALDAIEAAEALGLRVPEDLAVVGFSDHLQRVEHFRVPLTSVRMDTDRMGRLAMQTLLQEIEEGVSGRRTAVRVGAELVVRASSGTAVAGT